MLKKLNINLLLMQWNYCLLTRKNGWRCSKYEIQQIRIQETTLNYSSAIFSSRLLVSNFSRDQLSRYEMYRRSVFPKAAIRKVCRYLHNFIMRLYHCNLKFISSRLYNKRRERLPHQTWSLQLPALQKFLPVNLSKRVRSTSDSIRIHICTYIYLFS